MTCYINTTSSPIKHCQHLCIFHRTTYCFSPTKALKNKTHTSANEIIVGSQSTHQLSTSSLSLFQTFHIYSMHPFKVIAPLCWIISRYLMELIPDKKVMDRRHKLKTKVEIVFESPICQTLKALTLTLQMAWYPKINWFGHLRAEMSLPIE
jgi:hypothetical protein